MGNGALAVRIDYTPTDRANSLSFAELAELLRTAQALSARANAAVVKRKSIPTVTVSVSLGIC